MSHPSPTIDPNCRVASASCPPPRVTYYCDTVFILNIQWWFWDDPNNDKDFLDSAVAIILGCIQDYWLFLMGCVLIIALIFLIMACFHGRNLFRAFTNEDGPHDS